MCERESEFSAYTATIPLRRKSVRVHVCECVLVCVYDAPRTGPYGVLCTLVASDNGRRLEILLLHQTTRTGFVTTFEINPPQPFSGRTWKIAHDRVQRTENRVNECLL